MTDRPTFKDHDYFMKDKNDYTSRAVFQEHVRHTNDKTRELRDDTKELQAQTEVLHQEMRDYHGELDEVIEGNLIQTKVDERVEQKYNDLDQAYNTQLNGLTAQLAHIHYDVKNEGAIGDGVEDDSDVIQAILNKMNDGDSIYFPNGVYRTTKTLTITRAIKFDMEGYISADHNQIALLAKNDEPRGNFSSQSESGAVLKINPNIRRVRGKGYELDSTAIGLEIWNSYYGKFNLQRLIGHNTGLKLVGSRYGTGYEGTTYCNFTIGLIANYEKNILFETENTGYVTQNQFYSGSLSVHRSDSLISTHVVMNNVGTSVINENTFFGVSFEGHADVAIDLTKATSNKFISCRFEMPAAQLLFDFKSSRRNEITSSDYVGSFMRANQFSDNVEQNASETVVEWSDYLLGLVTYFDRKFYIKPLFNHGGINSASNNGVRVDRVPENWDVELLKEGMTDYFRSINNATITNRLVEYNVRLGDNYNMSFSSNDPVDGFLFVEPPTHSKDLLISLRHSQKEYVLNISSDFDDIIDLTGGNLTIPVGTTFVRLHYSYVRNRIYVNSYE